MTKVTSAFTTQPDPPNGAITQQGLGASFFYLMIAIGLVLQSQWSAKAGLISV